MRTGNRGTERGSGMRGVYAASVTPRRAGDTGADLGATLEILDFLSSAGVDGIVLFGSTGEFPLFETDDRARCVNLAVKRSHRPICVNVSHPMLDAAISLAEQAAGSGAEGVLVMPAIYFRHDQESVREYMLRFLDAVGKWIAVYLYNIPAFTTAIELETAAELLSRGFSGIKDSSGSWEYLHALLTSPAASSKLVLSGSEMLYARARAIGAAGAVSGIAACIPELIVALDRALMQGDTARSDALLAWVEEFLDWHRRFPVPLAIREAANARGLKAGAATVPLGPEKAKEMEAFRAWFRDWHRVVIRECTVTQAKRA